CTRPRSAARPPTRRLPPRRSGTNTDFAYGSAAPPAARGRTRPAPAGPPVPAASRSARCRTAPARPRPACPAGSCPGPKRPPSSERSSGTPGEMPSSFACAPASRKQYRARLLNRRGLEANGELGRGDVFGTGLVLLAHAAEVDEFVAQRQSRLGAEAVAQP